MKKSIISLLVLMSSGFGINQVQAQTASTSDNLTIQPAADETLEYEYYGTGKATPVMWGLDTAWDWDRNLIVGSSYMGKENVDVMRLSFTPRDPLINGTDLTTNQISELDWRISLLENYGNANTVVTLNNDGDNYDQAWYKGFPARWATLIDKTTEYIQNAGHTVVTVGPFNEPDYSTEQGTMQDFYDICSLLNANSRFDNIRIGGGNTLNCNEALNWYTVLNKGRLDEGNTHQLAGDFDPFVTFIETVVNNGDWATLDEMHNVMEAMVGANYGIKTGIWWGPAWLARGEFCKASRDGGVQLGYAENRPNWTAASVYRNPAGEVKGFTGGSERQATTTTYRFVSKDQAVFYDGYGPQREFIIEQPGGTGYWQNQPNGERVISITQGDDIQPAIDGTYVIVNRNSHKVLEVNGTNIDQRSYLGGTNQKWKVTRIPNDAGGDFSYYELTPQSATSMRLDNGDAWWYNGSNIYPGALNYGNDGQKYNLEYVEDGWFYIRNKTSNQCVDVLNAGTYDGANVILWPENGNNNQQWRLIPASAIVNNEIEFVAPAEPTGLIATANVSSVQLDWTASVDNDVTGYTIFRAESSGGPYITIARNVTVSSFVDNTVATGVTYYYAIKAVDECLNRSGYSNEVSVTTSVENGLVAQYLFDGDTKDNSANRYNGVTPVEPSFVEGQGAGSQAIALNGTDDFVKLPATLANNQEITVSTWVYWNGGAPWQQIFSFGNNATEYMYLTPQMRFAIKNGGTEEYLIAPALPKTTWTHVAVTLGTDGVRIYVNGSQVAESNTFTISTMDFKPIFNYIARSQANTPLFYGNVDDFRVYNYALSPGEVSLVASGLDQYSQNLTTDVFDTGYDAESNLSIWPVPANDVLYVNYTTQNYNELSTLALFNLSGRMVMQKEMKSSFNTTLNVSNLPSGIYMLRLTGENEILTEKVVVKH